MKRLGAIAVAVIAVVGLGIFLAGLGGARSERVVTVAGTNCQESTSLVLLAQSVPTAQLVPCLTEAADGWIVTSQSYSSSGSTVVLDTDLNGATWTITLAASCDPDPAATERPSNADSGVHTVGLETTDPDDRTETDTEWYRFTGGCVTSSVAIPDRFDSAQIFDQMQNGFVFATRSSINQLVVDDSDGRLTLDPPGAST